ncbi:MAG: hypothetical protein WBE79_14050 [Candidatus Cybelea sp.]
MRRVVGSVATAALVLALIPNVASASGLLPQSSKFDMGSQLMLRLFGETSDSTASFAAAHGDRASESPLRSLALQVHSGGPTQYLASDFTSTLSEDQLALRAPYNDQGPSFAAAAESAPFDLAPSVARFTAPSSGSSDVVTLAPSAHFTAAYQPVPQTVISPAPGTQAFAPPEIHASDFLSSPAQIGSVKFEGHADDSAPATPQLTLHDASYDAGANFDVRAGKRNLSVNLSSGYEHVGSNDSQNFSVSPLGSASSWQLPGVGTALVVPNNSDLNRLSLGAGVSVPVLHGLTLNLNYDAQRLYGAYGLPGLMNLDAVNNTYGGNLTFNIPRISSSLSIGAYQERLQDNILPINGSSQTREDVNFTVKF